MMRYFLQANAFLLLFYVLYYLLLRRETFFGWNRGYLLLSVGLSLTIPALKMPEFLQRNAEKIPLPAPVEQILVVPAPVKALPAPAPQTGFDLWGWILIGYAVVVAVLLIRFLVSIVWLWYIGKDAVWQASGYYLARLPDSPQSFSFFRTLFLGKTDQLTEAQITQIIHHELAHIKQRHTWDIVFLEIVTICFWINPIGQLYKKAIRKVHEYLADKAALASQNDRTDYANLILIQSKKAT